MLIKCPNCTKSFNVKDHLIPDKGRLLQCGTCNNKWYFKKKIINKENVNKIENTTKNIPIDDTAKKKIVEKVVTDQDLNVVEKYINKKQNKVSTNYIKLFLVLIITFVAIIVLLDTFKVYISNFMPQIDTILNNLYETLKDMYLFFEDLIR